MQPALEKIRVEDLVPYEKNPRTHSAEQISSIAASLKRFGWVAPVLIDERNVIIAGHGRLEAAKQAWSEGARVAGCDEGIIPCVRSRGLTPQQIIALRVADNKLAQLSHFDDEMLSESLRALSESILDAPEALGFTESELSDILASPDQDQEEADDDMESADVPAERDPYSVISFSCIVSADQSRMIQDSLADEMARISLESHGEALVAICRRYSGAQ